MFQMNQTNLMMAVGVLVVVLSCYYMYREVNTTKRDLDVTRTALRSMQEDFANTMQSLAQPRVQAEEPESKPQAHVAETKDE